MAAFGHRGQTITQRQPRLQPLRYVGQQGLENVVAHLQPPVGEQRNAPIHRRQRIGEVLAHPLGIVAGVSQFRGRAFKVAGLGPDLRLKRDGRLERTIGRRAHLMLPAGPAHQRVDDLGLAGNLDVQRLVLVDHTSSLRPGSKKATPTKVWFT